MIRFAAAAIWIAAVTVGSVLYSFQSAQGRSEAVPTPTLFSGLDYIRSGIVSVPMMNEGQIYGYFLARLVYTVEPAKLARLAAPPEALLMDQVYSYLYANPQIDFTDRTNIDLDALRNGIRDSINARVGDPGFVHDIFIEQIDFLSKNEIRDNTVRRRLSSDPGPDIIEHN